MPVRITDIDLQEFKDFYSVNSNQDTAKHFHLGIRTVSRWAQKLGFHKDPEYYFKVKSESSLVGWRKYGKKDHPMMKPEAKKRRSESLRKVIRDERRRLMFGLDPITKLGVKVSPESERRTKILRRYKLKKNYGYIPDPEVLGLIYYGPQTKRRLELEERYIKIGIKFKAL